MSHSYAQNTIHLVFSTKERRNLIAREIEPKLHAYVCGICKNHGIFVLAVGGMQDHLHLLIQLPAVLPLAKAVATIKSNSSRWAREEGDRIAWQQGYGAFSVSQSVVPDVVRYIRTQEQHHRKMRFEDEFVTLLKLHKIEYDPKFVFG